MATTLFCERRADVLALGSGRMARAFIVAYTSVRKQCVLAYQCQNCGQGRTAERRRELELED